MAMGAVAIVFIAALVSTSTAAVFKVGDEVTLVCPRLQSTNFSLPRGFTYFPVLKRERTNAFDGNKDTIRISQPSSIVNSGEAVYCGDPATAAECQSLKNRTTAENIYTRPKPFKFRGRQKEMLDIRHDSFPLLGSGPVGDQLGGPRMQLGGPQIQLGGARS